MTMPKIRKDVLKITIIFSPRGFLRRFPSVNSKCKLHVSGNRHADAVGLLGINGPCELNMVRCRLAEHGKQE